MAPEIPTIAAIQRTNVLLAILSAGAMAYWRSLPAAAACLLGGGLAIVNLFVLSLWGRAALQAAQRVGRATWLGAFALPVKLLMVTGIVYLIFARARVDGAGFALGVLTQPVAIFIETWRTRSKRRAGTVAAPG